MTHGSRFNIKGEVAFITGAGRGIGRTLAIALGQEGVSVGCFDLDFDGASQTASEIQNAGGEAFASHGSVSNPQQVAAAINATINIFGPLTLAINNAGIAHQAPAEELELSDWNRMLDVNLTGVFVCAQAEAREMIKTGKGSIVNIASMSGSIVNKNLTQSHYNTSKAAVMHLTKSLAVEWSRKGIRVNSISPGYTNTPMTQRPEVAHWKEEWVSLTPMGKMVEMDNLAGPTIFLLSEAASMCTGVDLLVDGGYVLW
jgi:NAD(P)-dependent dehydrogenase (short-subunit alcohol dehydrogenase family)